MDRRVRPRLNLVVRIVLLLVLCSGCDSQSQPPTASSVTQSTNPSVEVQTAPSANSQDASSDPVSRATQPLADVENAQPPSLDDLDSIPDDRRPKNGLASQRENRDKTVWKNETIAQEYEQAFVALWDELLAIDRIGNGDKFEVLARLAFESLTLGRITRTKQIDHGISVTQLGGNWQVLDPAKWQELLLRWKSEGYQLIQSEFHHAKFDPATDASAAKSSIAVAFYLTKSNSVRRLIVKGHVDIVWQPLEGASLPVPQTIDASNLSIWSRDGAPAFREILTVDHATPATRAGVQPIITYDLNGDGLSEILLGGSNELLVNQGSGKFQTKPLCAQPERAFETGLVADLNGDAIPDYLTLGVRGDLLFYKGGTNGEFTIPIGKAKGGGPLRQPQVVTAGDIDKDGDLDLWIAQYKISYVGGQMPTPYYDANDGFPAYLLINDGQGRFQPMTEEAGLAKKRNRRTYGSSFIDLDVDGDLDLLVVSDFSGIDVYKNDGNGYFEDVTESIVDERHLFGMSVTFADYNLDGQTDFFVSGMASTTARRLEYMRLGRRDRPDVHMMRSRMGYGNRMYVAEAGRFHEPTFKDEVARTGWTWGATSIDFDNDGDKDIFVANGHSSGKSTKDHCTHFWCHDIYDATSNTDFKTDALFKDVMKGYFNRNESWDGYQKNVLLLNGAGQSFSSIGFLMGVGHQYDGRAVIGDDLDGDGRMDLLVVEDQWNDGQILHVYRNELYTQNNWIGIRLKEEGQQVSPVGARVVLSAGDKQQVVHLVTGDSIHAQHAPTAHFGLGKIDAVDTVTIFWPNGQQTKLDSPQINRYHDVRLR